MSDKMDKLASEMRNLKASTDAHKRGMDAAMAAFETEFAHEIETESANILATETRAEKNRILEKKLDAVQGSSDAARPTGQNTHMSERDKSVPTLGTNIMTKVSQFFNFTPKAAMMGGSCMAALIASFVVFQSVPFDGPFTLSQPQENVTGVVSDDVSALAEVNDVDSPVISEPIAPISESAPNTARNSVKTAETKAGIETNTVIVERRIVKKPAQTIERVIPNVTKSETRRVQRQDGTYKTVTEPVVVQEASTELVTVPAQFETIRETIAIDADGSSRVTKSEIVPILSQDNGKIGLQSVRGSVPAIKEWLAGSKLPVPQEDVAAQSVAELNIPAPSIMRQSKKISSNTLPLRDGGTSEFSSSQPPAIQVETKQVSRRVIKTPASAIERFVPAITKDVTVEVQAEDGTFKTVNQTIVVEAARVEYITAPPVYETITETITVPKSVNQGRDKFEAYDFNPVTAVETTPVSTFSIDVDTASYSFLRASLNRGQLPPPGAIRLEEMINYFPYDYTAPTSPDTPFKANVTVTPTPWNADTKLMHIGIKGYVPTAEENPQSNIVLLIDTSGSMSQANKLPLLINSFKLLLNTLDADDTVSIVTYAGSAGTVLEPTSAGEKDKINAALQRLRAGGSTAGAAGLELAYMKAQESFKAEGVNRVILATDGDFNVGFSSKEEMKTFITKKRETGVFLSVLGFGSGNYNDRLMQTLAQNGNGVAAYIDTLSEANKVLANEAGSALITIAKDVKIQVEFNPDMISEYRLIGYETRALKREDFNNDKVDAGEIGAGHSVTAIYEMTPVNSPAQVFDPLRYVDNKMTGKTTGSDEYAFVKIRHKLPNADTSTLQTFPIGKSQERDLKQASDDMRFAAAVAAVGQKLRGDTQVADFSFASAIELASSAKGVDENGYRAEFIQLVRLAENLHD